MESWSAVSTAVFQCIGNVCSYIQHNVDKSFRASTWNQYPLGDAQYHCQCYIEQCKIFWILWSYWGTACMADKVYLQFEDPTHSVWYKLLYGQLSIHVSGWEWAFWIQNKKYWNQMKKGHGAAGSRYIFESIVPCQLWSMSRYPEIIHRHPIIPSHPNSFNNIHHWIYNWWHGLWWKPNVYK